MGPTGSNHESNRVGSWVEQGRLMGRSMSNHKSIRVDRVEQGRILSRTGSDHESNRVESWVEQGRIMSQTGSTHGSINVES